jgi:hypothetical protein
MLSQEVSKFLGVVGAHRESVDRFSSLTKKFYPSQHDYSLNLAVLSENSAQFGVSMDELNGAGQASTRNAAVVRATSVSPLLNQVKSGLKFKLSFANLFANSQNRVPKTVRYGLVLDKIEVGSPGEAHASITNEDVMGGTGSTKTVWKIGPLPETSDTPYLVNPAEAAGSWYGKIELPRFNFDTTISPASIPGAQPGAIAAPGLKLALSQEQQYYQYETQTNNKLSPQNGKHIGTMPLVGNLKVQRTLNHKLAVQKTSVLNVLAISSMPALNLNYLDPENRFTGDLKIVRPGMEIIVSADTPKAWNPIGDFGTSPAEKYEVKLTRNF